MNIYLTPKQYKSFAASRPDDRKSVKIAVVCRIPRGLAAQDSGVGRRNDTSRSKVRMVNIDITMLI